MGGADEEDGRWSSALGEGRMETTTQLNGARAQFERSDGESRDQLKRLIRRVWRKIERMQPLLLNKEEARILTSISNHLSMLEIAVDREIETQREV
jgi:hypothetical protein